MSTKGIAHEHKIPNYKKEGRPIAFTDESGFAHSMPRTHGYSLKGMRCYGKHDWGAKGRTNVIGALIGKDLLTVDLNPIEKKWTQAKALRRKIGGPIDALFLSPLLCQDFKEG